MVPPPDFIASHSFCDHYFSIIFVRYKDTGRDFIMKAERFFLFITALILTGSLLTGCGMGMRLFVSGYTSEGNRGFSVFDFNSRDGSLALSGSYDAGPDPSFFCVSPSGDMVYAVNEVMLFNGVSGGGVTTLAREHPGDSFRMAGELPVAGGGPCYISLSHDEKHLFLANYPQGSVAVVRLDRNGIPEMTSDFIKYDFGPGEESHAHMIMSDPQGEFVYVSDLGLDRILKYRFDSASGKLIHEKDKDIQVPPGSGPRHFFLSSDGKLLYLMNELGSTVMVFETGAKDKPLLLQTLPATADDFGGSNACADIHPGKDFRFVYGSNRGENSIVVFRTGKDGLLIPSGRVPCGGDWPRNFAVHPSGRFLVVANQRSEDLSVFRINRRTGMPEGPVSILKTPEPSCVRFF
jgi:6-phosphogluconolactonase